jgi:phospholipase C
MKTNRSGIRLSLLALLALALARPSDAARLHDIQHILIIYQENRSFDHYYGHFPGANGIDQADMIHTIQKDVSGIPYATLSIVQASPTRQGQADHLFPATVPNGPWDISNFATPDLTTRDVIHRFYHNFHQIDGGLNDEYVTWSDGGGMCMGHYDANNFPEGQLAQEFTLCDNYFQGVFGGSIANYIYFVSGQEASYPGGPASLLSVDSTTPATLNDNILSPDFFVVNNIASFVFSFGPGAPQLPAQNLDNIGNELSAKGVDWKSYTEGLTAAETDPTSAAAQASDGSPFLWFNGYGPGQPGFSHIQDLSQFQQDINNHALPAVMWIKNDDMHDEHPFTSSVLAGQQRVLDQVNAIRNSPYWNDTLILITPDEFGGWWDHVSPPREGDGHTQPGQADRFGPGPRIPLVIAGPFAKEHHVAHEQFEPGSILKLIQSRFHLKPLSTRNATANNLAQALDVDPDFDNDSDDPGNRDDHSVASPSNAPENSLTQPVPTPTGMGGGFPVKKKK